MNLDIFLKSVGASLALVAGIASSSAATITVNNNVGAVADFDNMTDAIAAASGDDTVLVAGSSTSYGTAALDKPLKIVGPGYFLTENGVPSVTPGIDDQPATMALTFANSTVAGSRFVGLTISSLNYGLVTEDILWDRCRFTSNIVWFSVTDFRATRSYFDGYLQIANANPANACINCSVIGCIFNRLYLYQGAVASHCTVRGIGNDSWIVVDPGSAITNSILIRWAGNGTLPHITGSVTHCVAINADLLPTGTGSPDINANYDNIAFADLGTIITAEGSSSTGIFFQLNTANGSNPALGNASDGSNIGAFGGPVPYRLAGQPSIPKISNLVVPGLASPTSGLNVKVTVTEPTP